MSKDAMLQTYEAVFKNGLVCFKTPPKGVKSARLLVTFLDRPTTVRRPVRRPRGSIEKAIVTLQGTFCVKERSLVKELIEERRQAAAHE